MKRLQAASPWAVTVKHRGAQNGLASLQCLLQHYIYVERYQYTQAFEQQVANFLLTV